MHVRKAGLPSRSHRSGSHPTPLSGLFSPGSMHFTLFCAEFPPSFFFGGGGWSQENTHQLESVVTQARRQESGSRS